MVLTIKARSSTKLGIKLCYKICAKKPNFNVGTDIQVNLFCKQRSARSYINSE